MKKIRIAIIGQGRSGRDIHGKYFKSKNNNLYDVIAVVEKDAQRRIRALEEYPGCSAYEDYRDLYTHGDKDIDLVVNASFSYEHYGITKDLLEHGFNVLVEKPFARSYYECCDLIKAAKDNGVLLTVFQQAFYTPVYTELKKLIAEGTIGKVKQVNIHYNKLARRWDWQTIQSKMGGSAYNTGPHPIGMALGLLDFDENARVEFSRIDRCLTSGDAEDYVKIIITAPQKPVIDIEISSMDAYSDWMIKAQGTKGTYQSTDKEFKIKYIVDGENEEQDLVFGALKDKEGYPAYCKEKLITHEEKGSLVGTGFDIGVSNFYDMLYRALVMGIPMEIDTTDMAKIVNVIEVVHAQNPMMIRY